MTKKFIKLILELDEFSLQKSFIQDGEPYAPVKCMYGSDLGG